MNLDAMRQFKKATGQDLWHTLMHLLEVYIKNRECQNIFELMRKLTGVVDFETASHLLYCLVKQEDKCVELQQIQDAMFRVGMRPVETADSDFCQPYPMVLVEVAHEIDSLIAEGVGEIKKGQGGEH